MKLTPGKLKGLKAVSTPKGVIGAAAMDQRGSLKKALGQHATDAGLEEFKSLVTEVLTPHASAILVCPPPSGAPKTPACCSPTRRPDTTKPAPDACPICSITGRCAA